MKKLWQLLVVPLVSIPILFATSSAHANDLALQTYANARVVFQSTQKVDDYVLGLGSYKKTSGNWRLDRQERLSGVLTRYTLELPSGHSSSNGFDFYLNQLQSRNLRELFHCQGRDCGTSNSWANNHFKIIQLYGLDQHQQYGAYEVTNANAEPFYVSLYAVQRGNRRVYMQIEVLQLMGVNELGVAASPASILRALNNSGYYVFPDFLAKNEQGVMRMQIKPAHLQALIDVLTDQPDLHLAVVGHDYSLGPLTAQQKNAQAYADQLKTALEAANIESDRLPAFGLGGLAPAGRGDRLGRVELVKIRR